VLRRYATDVLDSSLSAFLSEVENVVTALTRTQTLLLNEVRFLKLEMQAERQLLRTQALDAKTAQDDAISASTLLKQLARDLERTGSIKRQTQSSREFRVSRAAQSQTQTFQESLDSRPVPVPAPTSREFRVSSPTLTMPSEKANGNSSTSGRRDYDFFAELDYKLARLSEQTAGSSLD
jgi:hypothetical protein